MWETIDLFLNRPVGMIWVLLFSVAQLGFILFMSQQTKINRLLEGRIAELEDAMDEVWVLIDPDEPDGSDLDQAVLDEGVDDWDRVLNSNRIVNIDRNLTREVSDE